MIAVLAIAVIVGVRLVRRTQIHRPALVLALLDIAVQLLVVVLGLALVFSPAMLVDGFDFAAGQGWHDLLFALPLAMLAYTGLETVANLAEETREPGRVLPRSLFSSIGLVVIMTVLIAIVGAVGVPGRTTARPTSADDWLQAPIVGIVTAFDGHLPSMHRRRPAGRRRAVGRADPRSLPPRRRSRAARASAHSMAEHGMLPREFGRLERRSLVSRETIVAIGAVAIAIVIVTGVFGKDDAAFLASTYSFGVLLAFTVAQLAVIRLRRMEPDLARPFRAKPEVQIRGVLVPLAGADRRAADVRASWCSRWSPIPGARYAGPAWLLVGLVVYVRRPPRGARSECSRTSTRATLPPGVTFKKLLVPMKLGDIGEEMVATAVALAKERGATVEAIIVVQVPRECPLEGALPPTSASTPTRRSPRRARWARRTASRCHAHDRRPARSATRSSTRPATTAPT